MSVFCYFCRAYVTIPDRIILDENEFVLLSGLAYEQAIEVIKDGMKIIESIFVIVWFLDYLVSSSCSISYCDHR